MVEHQLVSIYILVVENTKYLSCTKKLGIHSCVCFIRVFCKTYIEGMAKISTLCMKERQGSAHTGQQWFKETSTSETN